VRRCTGRSRHASATSAADIGRLDAELVRRGLARSRGEARDLVAAGEVLVAGRPATKASREVEPGADLAVRAGGPRWVGRAAHKLAEAFAQWGPRGLSARGRRCVDVGSSTGGFTQVLLAQGAAHVVAVDVGHGQLAGEVARDPRVEERSGTTIRGLTAQDLGGSADVVVADLSFISLTVVMRDLAGLLADGGDLVLLVKPQFEVGRGRLNRQGVVTSARDRRRALQAVVGSLEGHGLHVHGILASPVRGTAGNAEYLLWARSVPSDTMSQDLVRDTIGALTTDSSGGRP
jgi:23S rRNA (cytidine1920-2'-O)/16S rRNA (cytidine1409-2'-O)-methyltransferase